MSRIYLSKADTTEVEEEYVIDALRSGWVAPLGPHVDAFEAEIAAYVGVGHALALSSGTAALHLALLGLGAGPGTAVIVPTMTFVASAAPVLYTGAVPVFVDASIEDGNIDPELLIHAVDTLRSEGTRVAAVVSVDLFGRCANYQAFLGQLEARGVALLEDAAEALGATDNGRPAGSFGAAAVLSFNGNKIMTTSGGGMLLSDDEVLVARARHLSTQAREPFPYYEHVDVGFNYRLSNLLAALGRAQLSRFPQMLGRRRVIRDRYAEAFGGLDGVRLLGRGDTRDDREDNCWLTCIELDPDKLAVRPDTLIGALAGEDIEARHLWKPMHLQPVFAGRRAFLTGTAQRLFERGVALPSGSALTDDDVSRVIDSVRRSLGFQ